MIHDAAILTQYGDEYYIGDVEGGQAPSQVADKLNGLTGPLEASDRQALNSGGTSHILPAERKKATFDVQQMTYVLDGGKANTARRHFIASPVQDCEGEFHHMGPEELLPA